ncbi:gluconokinase [Catalinimonas alkaloidigena]|uniref:gluconokinase n=1 Tax=Catalinimonas alkaloidigena TaxID=1075417 RepID=UPI002405EEE0|nr:gluconokinase [Catalinimonas alkaloidigena]MDF9799483.1 gluconokinase [Catalinimonas alkaloidigena]
MKDITDREQLIIGIDVGTTGVKVLAANPLGETVAVAEATYSLSQPEAGYREQDPEEILKVTEKNLKQVLDQLSRPVAAISFGAAMHSLIAIDDQGKALTPAIIWADVRSSRYASGLRKTALGRQLYEDSGAPVHAMLPLCKIAWLRDNQAEIFRKTHKFISIKEYCIAQWFGRYMVDYAIAGASGLWNKETLQWNQQALEWAGIAEHQLSLVVPPTYQLGRPAFRSFDHPNITEDTKFILGASDGCLANLNASGFNQKEATLTLGTSGAIRITARNTLPDPAMSIFDYYLTDQYHVIGGPTNNGGIVLDWLRQKFYPDISDPSVILQKAETAGVGAEGVICLPYFFGERAPLWREEVSGKFYGVQSQHGRDHFARAALEGIVFNLYGIAQTLQTASSSQIEGLWTDGGLTQSDFMAQLIANVFDLPVYRSSSTHGVARGAVLLGAFALGITSIEEIIPQKKNVFQPDKKAHQLLFEAYKKFIHLRDEREPD